jgi:hypothetical protein
LSIDLSSSIYLANALSLCIRGWQWEMHHPNNTIVTAATLVTLATLVVSGFTTLVVLTTIQSADANKPAAKAVSAT